MRRLKLWALWLWTWLRAKLGSRRHHIILRAVDADECDTAQLEDIVHREGREYPEDSLVERLRWTHGIHEPFSDD